MNILIIAATELEIPFFKAIQAQFSASAVHLELLISGVGILESSYRLQERLHQTQPDLVIQIGIAGSFEPHIKPGSVVLIERDRVADTIVKEAVGYMDLIDLGFQAADAYPYEAGWLVNPHLSNGMEEKSQSEGGKSNSERTATASITLSKLYNLLPEDYERVTGITVNEISTHPEKIAYFRHHYQAATESMEGASLHFVARLAAIPFLQIRAISNKVGDRNKKNWQIKAAIEALETATIEIIQRIAANPAVHYE